jgi:predicted transcriptional regulator
MYKMEKEASMKSNREKIIKELKENPNGFTVSELSKKLGFSRQTISNCFSFLEGAEKIKIRQVGMAKIYFWKVKNEK